MKKTIKKTILFYFIPVGIYNLIIYIMPIGKNHIVNELAKGMTIIQIIGFAFIGIAIPIKIVNETNKNKTLSEMEENLISMTALIGMTSIRLGVIYLIIKYFIIYIV